MSNRYYIASCVFSTQFPKLGLKIQDYVRERFGLTVVRCCVPKYKLEEFENRFPEGEEREKWRALPDSGAFKDGDEVYSLCHNCNNIIEEMHPGVKVKSLWELVDSDGEFDLPDLSGMSATLQDCWRARERAGEQEAVRSLLKKMRVSFTEAPENRENTRFCGNSLYRAQPPRNPKLAPRHYIDGAKGLFIPHTPEEQKRIMTEYCESLPTRNVICYCHYCLEGLITGGADGVHMAQLLFDGGKSAR